MVEYEIPKRTLILWQIRLVATALIFLSIYTYFCSMFDWYMVVFTVMAFIFILALVWYVPKLFKSYKITYKNGAVIIKKGVFIKTVNIMPYSKLIYTQSMTTPLAKMMGLSAITLKAARSRAIVPEISTDNVEKLAILIAEGKER